MNVCTESVGVLGCVLMRHLQDSLYCRYKICLGFPSCFSLSLSLKEDQRDDRDNETMGNPDKSVVIIIVKAPVETLRHIRLIGRSVATSRVSMSLGLYDYNSRPSQSLTDDAFLVSFSE